MLTIMKESKEKWKECGYDFKHCPDDYVAPTNKDFIDFLARAKKVIAEDKNHHLVNASGTFVDYPLVKGTYYSGGAGLCSTIKDYAIFLQMLLNKGEYKGKRLLARHTVDLMTTNQIGDLNLGKDKFGLGFEITTASGQERLGISEGSFAWGGYFATKPVQSF